MLQAQYADSGHPHLFASRAASHEAKGQRHLPQVAAFPAVTATPAARPAQMKLDRKKAEQRIRFGGEGYHMTKVFRNNLIKDIIAYNQAEFDQEKIEKRRIDPQAYVHQQMERLDALEHKLYGWFDRNTGKNIEQNAPGMFNLLDEIQFDHEKLIGITVNENMPLWMHGELSNEDRDEANLLWAEIQSGMRGLRITNSFEDGTELSGGQQQRFNTHVYAQLARLMSRPVGRRLLRVILDSSTPEKQVLLRMFPLPQMLDNTKGARRIGAKAFPLPNQPSEFTVQDDNTIVKGAGAGSNVSLVPGIRDSTMMDHDMDGNKILSPSFIGLGHELIHSARYLDGSYVGMSNPHPEGVATQLPPGYHGDIEEFLTIASGNEREDQKGRSKKTIRIYGSDEKGNETKHLMRYTELLNQVGHIPTEAEIREEHGLSIRHGHSSEINPYRFGVLPPNTDPGDVVTDGVEWLNEFLNL